MDILKEKLNKIDHYCIDNNLKFRDLRSLYEAVSPKFTPKDKMELKKVINATNDPGVIEATLQQLQNESLKNSDLVESGSGSELSGKLNKFTGGIIDFKNTVKKNFAKKDDSEEAKRKAAYDRWVAFQQSEEDAKKKKNEGFIDEYDDDDYDDWQMGNIGKFSKSDWIPTEEDIPEWARYDEPIYEKYSDEDEDMYNNMLDDLVRYYNYKDLSKEQVYNEIMSEYDDETLANDVISNLDESLDEDTNKITATDIVRDLYNRYPNVIFLDERDTPDDRVALFFKFSGDVTGLEDLLNSYNCEYKIRNGQLRIIANDDEDFDESLKEDYYDSFIDDVGKVDVKKSFTVSEFDEDDGWFDFEVFPGTYEYRVLDINGWKPRQLKIDDVWVDVNDNCKELEDLLGVEDTSLSEYFNVLDDVDASDSIGELKPGDQFKNRNDVIVTIIEPTKDGKVQFKIGNDVRIGTQKSIQHMLYDNNYMRIEESLSESKSKNLQKEIYKFLDGCGGYTDYNQKVEDVQEYFGLSADEAESIVSSWALGIH